MVRHQFKQHPEIDTGFYLRAQINNFILPNTHLMTVKNSEHYFLTGGGEMGEQIRATDWSKTSLGDPENWPPSLRTMVAVMLDNPFSMYIAWGNEYIQLYNDGYRPILGTTKHPQALGISTRETFAEIWHIIGAMFDGVMQGKSVGFSDFTLPLNRNGFVEKCYFDFSYSPIRKENGEVGGVLVTVIETTNKKKAEENLKLSEERFRAMADNIPNLAWMANADGWIYWYNKQWFAYTGTSAEQMEGWGWQSVHDPQELPRVLDKWQASITSGQPFDMVFPLKGADGKFRQFLTRVLPVRNEEGVIYQWFGTNTDITEQKNTEEALKESEERFRTMAEGTEILIAVGDESGDATYFNKAWMDLTGRAMEDLLEFGWVDLVHPEDKERFVNIFLRAFEKKISFSGEFRVLNKDGQYRWLLAKGPPRFKPDGTFTGYISSCVDITEIRLAEEALKASEQLLRNIADGLEIKVKDRTIELEQKNMELEKMNKELQSFAYISSHDLQEPLRKIQTYSSRLIEKEYENLSESGKDSFQRMHNAAKRMQILIDDLLAYSRTNIGERKFESINLGKIVDEVKEDLQEELQQKHATIEATEMCEVRIIVFQFRQLLYNLISNALKFSKDNHPPHIKITSKMVQGAKLNNENLDQGIKYCHICISDNGIGFDPQYGQKIFEVFQRLHGKNEYSGTGIGLAIVKKIVENHNGIITAKGKINKGASFDIFIPAT